MKKTGGNITIEVNQDELTYLITSITECLVGGNPILGELLCVAVTTAPQDVVASMLQDLYAKRPDNTEYYKSLGNMLLAIKATIETH